MTSAPVQGNVRCPPGLARAPDSSAMRWLANPLQTSNCRLRTSPSSGSSADWGPARPAATSCPAAEAAAPRLATPPPAWLRAPWMESVPRTEPHWLTPHTPARHSSSTAGRLTRRRPPRARPPCGPAAPISGESSAAGEPRLSLQSEPLSLLRLLWLELVAASELSSAAQSAHASSSASLQVRHARREVRHVQARRLACTRCFQGQRKVRAAGGGAGAVQLAGGGGATHERPARSEGCGSVSSSAPLPPP